MLATIHHASIHSTSTLNHAPAPPSLIQCDPGANVCATNNASLLTAIQTTDFPLTISAANIDSTDMAASTFGQYRLLFTDHSHVDVTMYFCPQLPCTIVSPQSVIKEMTNQFDGFYLVDVTDKQPALIFVSAGKRFVMPLVVRHNLYFLLPSPLLVHAASANSVLQAELWHMRLGHPGQHQLSTLPPFVTGMPPNLVSGRHPLSYCDTCHEARHRRSAMGPTSDFANILCGSRFHLDFGFMRASSVTFGKTKGDRVVTSYDGFNSYFLITDAKSAHGWVFLTASKSPPP